MWTPYRWEPIIRPGEDLRLTLKARGTVAAMKALINGAEHHMTISGDGAQLLIPADQAATIPDRAPVSILVAGGGVWTTLMEGHAVRRTDQ